jgi:hypothetical protein
MTENFKATLLINYHTHTRILFRKKYFIKVSQNDLFEKIILNFFSNNVFLNKFVALMAYNFLTKKD